MSKTKADLINDLQNMTYEKDVLVDQLEATTDALDKLEDDLAELDRKAETLDILI